jgi:glycosyltransferase involved in cell wall biosynthesis
MIVKDEEKYLPDCLDSIKHHIDELVIVDTGSTDKTKAILLDYYSNSLFDGSHDVGVLHRVKLLEREWDGDFSAARNYGIKKATGDWLLIIDADERVPQIDMIALRKLLVDYKEVENHDAIAVDILNAYKREGLEGHNFAPQTAQMRIFRNGVGFCYDMKVHNQPVTTNKPALKIGLRIIHYGYETEAFKGDKAKRYITMCRKQAEETPGIPIVHYNLAQALKTDGDTFQAQHAEEMCDHLGQAIELSLGSTRGIVETKNGEQNQFYYDAVYAEGYDTSRYSKMYQTVIEMVKDEPYVLELGCGTGDLGAMLCATTRTVVVEGGGTGIKNGKRVDDKHNHQRMYRGVDFSQEAIAQARKKIAKEDGVLALDDIYSPKVYEGNWSCAVALEVLEHVDDLRIANLIPVDKRVIFSVPDFPDKAHLRTYAGAAGIKDRFKLLFDIKNIEAFEMGAGGTIYLVDAVRKVNPYESILVQSYNLLGWVYYWGKEYMEAIKCGISALRLKRDYLDSVLLVAYAFGDAGEFNSAEAWFWRYLDFQRKYNFAAQFDGITTSHPDERVSVYRTLANIEMVRRQIASDEIAKSLKGKEDGTAEEERAGAPKDVSEETAASESNAVQSG